MLRYKCFLKKGLEIMRTVNLKQWGNLMAVRLPKSVLTQAGIGNSPTVFDISVNNDKEIILRKKKKPKNLKELFKGFDYKKYWAEWNQEHSGKSKEINWGESVGREKF